MIEPFVRYNDLCVEIEVAKEQIKLTEYELEYWFGINFHDRELNGIPFAARGVNRFGTLTALNQTDDKIKMLNKLREHLEELEQAKSRIESLLGKFDRLEYKIAYKRFVEGKTLRVISEELSYSYDYVRELMSKMKKAM